MNEIRTVTRRDLIDLYLKNETVKKNKQIPTDYNSLVWEDPNTLDKWLQVNGYKYGVITGFKQWEYVQLSKDDLSTIAVVNHIFRNGRVLGKLIGKEEFEEWVPNQASLPIWYEPLNNGEFEEQFSVTLRAPTPGEKREGARLYTEDGSGRSICYYRSIFKKNMESRMCGYIGFEPDPKSNFLQSALEKEFANNNNGNKYSTFEKLKIEIFR